MIYILEDDASIRKLVVYTLNSQRSSPCGLACAGKAWGPRHPEDQALSLGSPYPEDHLQGTLRGSPA